MRIYARRLADIDRTVDVNLMSQKMPIFAVVPESQRLTIQNLMKQYVGNEPIIVGADGMFDRRRLPTLVLVRRSSRPNCSKQSRRFGQRL